MRKLAYSLCTLAYTLRQSLRKLAQVLRRGACASLRTPYADPAQGLRRGCAGRGRACATRMRANPGRAREQRSRHAATIVHPPGLRRYWALSSASGRGVDMVTTIPLNGLIRAIARVAWGSTPAQIHACAWGEMWPTAGGSTAQMSRILASSSGVPALRMRQGERQACVRADGEQRLYIGEGARSAAARAAIGRNHWALMSWQGKICSPLTSADLARSMRAWSLPGVDGTQSLAQHTVTAVADSLARYMPRAALLRGAWLGSCAATMRRLHSLVGSGQMGQAGAVWRAAAMFATVALEASDCLRLIGAYEWSFLDTASPGSARMALTCLAVHTMGTRCFQVCATWPDDWGRTYVQALPHAMACAWDTSSARA